MDPRLVQAIQILVGALCCAIGLAILLLRGDEKTSTAVIGAGLFLITIAAPSLPQALREKALKRELETAKSESEPPPRP